MPSATSNNVAVSITKCNTLAIRTEQIYPSAAQYSVSLGLCFVLTITLQIAPDSVPIVVQINTNKRKDEQHELFAFFHFPGG